jgi:hypothetical protein
MLGRIFPIKFLVMGVCEVGELLLYVHPDVSTQSEVIRRDKAEQWWEADRRISLD